VSDYSKRKRGKRPAREHKRITRRMRPGAVGRRRSKFAERKRVQNATSGVVRRARKARA
jgi:hypothetical protein